MGCSTSSPAAHIRRRNAATRIQATARCYLARHKIVHLYVDAIDHAVIARIVDAECAHQLRQVICGRRDALHASIRGEILRDFLPKLRARQHAAVVLQCAARRRMATQAVASIVDLQVLDEQCAICMCGDADVSVLDPRRVDHHKERLTQLDCGHTFHVSCLLAQIDNGTRHNAGAGVRLTHRFLDCAVCRKQLHISRRDGRLRAAAALSSAAAAPRREREQCYQVCYTRARREGAIKGLRRMGAEQARAAVERTMAAYRCTNCSGVFCGGLNACTAAGDESGGNGGANGRGAVMLCHECSYSMQARKCDKHGARYAVYKCDCCCSIATYDCGGNHYCDQCHATPYDGAKLRQHCRGRPEDKCPLGVPHPQNVPRQHNKPKNGYVVGCTKCLGIANHCDNFVSDAAIQRFAAANTEPELAA